MSAQFRYGSSGSGYGSSPLFGYSYNDGYPVGSGPELILSDEEKRKNAEDRERQAEERRKRLEADGVTLPGLVREAALLCNRLEQKRRTPVYMSVAPEPEAVVSRLYSLCDTLRTDVHLLPGSISTAERNDLQGLALRCLVAWHIERVVTMGPDELVRFEWTYGAWDHKGIVAAFQKAVARRRGEFEG